MTDEIKFEKAMEKLEKIVEDLEAGNLGLDEALKQYEEGVRLVRICQKTLSQAEKKIETLTRALDGHLEKQDFDPEAEEPAEPSAKNKKIKKSAAKSKEGAEDEKDFLL